MTRVLAIETSGRAGSVAAGQSGRALAEAVLPGRLRHAAELLPALAGLCDRLGWWPKQVDHIHVSAGPGSFTGLRIGITAAKVFAHYAGARLVSVPTLDAVACNAPAGTAHVAVVLDAKRGQVYAGVYSRAADGTLRRATGPVLADPAQLVAAAPRPLLLLGEGVDYHRAALSADRVEQGPRELWPARASAVLALGWQRACAGQFVDPLDLVPTYVRPPEAEEKWAARHGRQTGRGGGGAA